MKEVGVVLVCNVLEVEVKVILQTQTSFYRIISEEITYKMEISGSENREAAPESPVLTINRK